MKVLLIGMGMVADTHVRALRDNTAGAHLIGVLGRDAERTAAFCAGASDTLGHPIAALTNIDTALSMSPDMGILITPPNARAPFADALARMGVPTLMEKPIERTLSAARSIVETYAHAKVPLGICFQLRTRDAAQALKARLTAGDLGNIEHVEIRVPWWRDQTYYNAAGRGTYAQDGGGVMITQAIHTLDLALWLAGPAVRLQAQMRTSSLHVMEAEDIASALLTFRSGASGVLNATTAAYPGAPDSIALTTTRAQVLLAGDTLHIDWHDGTQDHIAPSADMGTGSGANPMAFSHVWHQSILEDFVQAVHTKSSPLAPAHEALHVHAVIDAMERAARSETATEVAQ